MFNRVHQYAWGVAVLIIAFVLELSGTFRIGASGIFASLIIILLAGFFEVRWFAGFLAFLLLALSFFLAPFWVFEISGVALIALFLILTTSLLTGSRSVDFLILLAAGVLVVTFGSMAVHGGEFSFGVIGLTLLMNLFAGFLAFTLCKKIFYSSHHFTQ